MRIGKIIHFWLLKEKHFVLLDPLTRPVKNPINIFIISSKIVFYHVLFIKCLWISKIWLASIALKFTNPFNHAFSYH